MKNKFTNQFALFFGGLILVSTVSLLGCAEPETNQLPLNELDETTESLHLEFVNNTGLDDSLVFITFQTPFFDSTQFDISYIKTDINTGKDTTYKKIPVLAKDSNSLMSQSLSLAEIKRSGLNVKKLMSGIVFVSYGAKLKSTNSAPSFIGSEATDYYTPFQTFELTMQGGNSDQGDMTAINYFTAPMSITSYSSLTGKGDTDSLQGKSYNLLTSSILQQLITVTNNDSSAVILSKDKSNYIRIIGPSSYSINNPYTSFGSYLYSVEQSNDTTKIHTNNAFNDTCSPPNNYNFILDLKAYVKDSIIYIKGNIDVQKNSQNDTTFKNVSVTINGTHEYASLMNNAIYGQVINRSVTFGSEWGGIGSYMDTNSLSGALSTTKNLMIGELTTALLLGLVNSDSLSSNGDTLKNMSSDKWWIQKPMKAFSQAQSNPKHYNEYANVLYNASNNEVYTIPYSDRLGNGPLINSVSYNGTKVKKWIITLEPPLGKVSNILQ